MEKEKKSNKKIIWSVLFAFVTIILCYMFVVLYFFYISPNDIALKLSLWPFLPDKTIGEIYLDSTVEIDFKVWDEDEFALLEKQVVGVNVRKDGFVLAPFTQMRGVDESTEITIKINSGKSYAGKLLYSDEFYNISILKCENIDSDDEISLPYAKIADNNHVSKSKVLAISSPLYSKNTWTGKIEDDSSFCVFSTIEVGGFDAIDYMVENCFSVNLSDDFSGGAIFNKKGVLLGFSYDSKLQDGSHVIMPTYDVKYFFENVVNAYENGLTYKNNLIKNFVGFDAIETRCYIDFGSNIDANGICRFYFNGDWQLMPDEMVRYSQNYNSRFGDGDYFYLFENFVFDDQEIEKNNLITCIDVGNRRFEIHDRSDLLKALYSAKSGDKLKIWYKALDEMAQTLFIQVSIGEEI